MVSQNINKQSRFDKCEKGLMHPYACYYCMKRAYTACEKPTVMEFTGEFGSELFSVFSWSDVILFKCNVFGSAKPRWGCKESKQMKPSLPHLSKHTNTIFIPNKKRLPRCTAATGMKPNGEIESKDKWGVLNRPCFHQSAKVNMCLSQNSVQFSYQEQTSYHRCSITANTLTREQMYTHLQKHTHTHTLF